MSADITLLDKHLLLVEAACDPEVRGLPYVLLTVVVERYVAKKGNSEISLRSLARGARARRNNVAAALQVLIERDYLAVVSMGSGTAASRYLPNFAKGAGAAERLLDRLKGRVDLLVSPHAGTLRALKLVSPHAGTLCPPTRGR
jgi:hypothetical protein